MNKKAKITLSIFITLVLIASVFLVSTVVAKPNPRAVKACRDGLDNDGDNLIDYPNDPGCSDKNDRSEFGSNECDDGIDNDGDGNTDIADSGCHSAFGTDESDCGDLVCEGGEDCDSCANDCLDSGEICYLGISYSGDCCEDNDCTSPETCVDHVCQIADSCSDTDGFNEFVQGTVLGDYDQNPYSHTDYCDNATSVVEYYCSRDIPNTWIYDCSINNTGCSNGACY